MQQNHKKTTNQNIVICNNNNNKNMSKLWHHIAANIFSMHTSDIDVLLHLRSYFSKNKTGIWNLLKQGLPIRMKHLVEWLFAAIVSILWLIYKVWVFWRVTLLNAMIYQLWHLCINALKRTYTDLHSHFTSAERNSDICEPNRNVSFYFFNNI